jgi:16S rRNA (cytosine967-C5)-methyltransferase
VQELCAKQAAILNSAARLLKSGGRLVYATCSLLQEENEAIAKEFSQMHADFETLDVGELLTAQKIEAASSLCCGDEDRPTRYLRLWPHQHGTDGFFAAVWVKK